MSKRDVLSKMTINDMVKSIEEDKGDTTGNWTVWVGGGEVNSHYLQEHQAKDIAQAWIDKGYDDVVVEEVGA